MRLYCLMYFLLFALEITAKPSKQNQSVILWIRAGLAQPNQFNQYFEKITALPVDVIHLHIPMQIWNANHSRDLRKAEKMVIDLAEDYQSIHLFGYSIGAKFAAALAQKQQLYQGKIQSVFLLDPVDGGPPMFPYRWPHMPVFLSEGNQPITVPTYVLETQFGSTSNNLWGFSCVTRGLGASHFARMVDPLFLKSYSLKGAGHLQVVEKLSFDPGNATENSCVKGPRKRETLIPEAAQFFAEYAKDQLSGLSGPSMDKNIYR